MASETLRFARLKGRENYDTWKIAAKSYLVIKQCWSCIVSGLPEKPSKGEMEADLLAWSQLNLLLEEGVFSYIADTQTSKAAWDALKSAFEDSGLCRKVDLLKQLVQLKLTECISVEDYVNKMVMTSMKVKKAGLDMGDEIIASLMLAGLPDEYRPLVMAVENSGKAITTDSVKNLLLQESRLGIENGDGEGAALYLKKKKEHNNFRCHNCGKAGHFAKFCPEKAIRGEMQSCPQSATRGESYLAEQVGASNSHSVRRGDPF